MFKISDKVIPIKYNPKTSGLPSKDDNVFEYPNGVPTVGKKYTVESIYNSNNKIGLTLKGNITAIHRNSSIKVGFDSRCFKKA